MVKVLFFGTPQIAVPFLEWLHAHETVLSVVCRPDEPAGRGYQIKPPPTKVFALDHNIPVFQPESFNPDGPTAILMERALKDVGADVGIVVAFGRILPKSIYMAPRLGCVNIHFSLLPKFRGAAPMQRSLMSGETQTGVSAFWLDDGMDAGPLFQQASLAIDPADDTVSLRTKLISLGVDVLGGVMKKISAGDLVRQPQEGPVSLAPPLKKEEGVIDWKKPAASIANLIRGVVEWPGAQTSCHAKNQPVKKIKIIKARAECSVKGTNVPGTILEVRKSEGLLVQAGDGAVLLMDVQPEGKKPMPALAFWQGAHLDIGTVLGTHPS